MYKKNYLALLTKNIRECLDVEIDLDANYLPYSNLRNCLELCFSYLYKITDDEEIDKLIESKELKYFVLTLFKTKKDFDCITGLYLHHLVKKTDLRIIDEIKRIFTEEWINQISGMSRFHINKTIFIENTRKDNYYRNECYNFGYKYFFDFDYLLKNDEKFRKEFLKFNLKK